MARANLNPVLRQLRGAVGDLIFKRYGEKVVVTRKPQPSSKPPSPRQLAHQKRFAAAARYGVEVSETPALRAIYEPRARAEQKAVYTIALGDAMRAPVVEGIDASEYGEAGGAVVVRARDNFEVVRVEVALLHSAGDVLEEGEAEPTRGAWVYRSGQSAEAAATIRARAYDRPGNVGEMEVVVPSG